MVTVTHVLRAAFAAPANLKFWNGLNAMMDHEERERALDLMRRASDDFYRSAVRIGNHPFIEFAGLMNEYINACGKAHKDGVDFSRCSRHTGQTLPLHPTMADYINEKLECIFAGSKVLDASGV